MYVWARAVLKELIWGVAGGGKAGSSGFFIEDACSTGVGSHKKAPSGNSTGLRGAISIAPAEAVPPSRERSNAALKRAENKAARG